jgi:hypothetical protein
MGPARHPLPAVAPHIVAHRGRITIYERWESDEDLHRFRSSGKPREAGDPEPPIPALHGTDVHKYRISGVEAP